jgi:hypothetical protein
MLNAKTLRKLVIITTVCAVPVIFIAFKGGIAAIHDKNQIFIPDLIKNKDQISKIIMQDYSQKLTLQKVNGSWLMLERNNYPVLTDKVEDLIYSLADLRIIEPKTNNRAYFKQLDVNDITEPDSQALLVMLQDGDNINFAKVYIGKREGVRLGEEYQEHIFVRRADEDQTWLVQGVVPLSSDFRDWVEQPLLGLIDSDQIKSVAIQRPQADKIVIAKNKQDQEDFILETLSAKKGMVLDLDAVNTVPFELAELEYSDVLPVASVDAEWDKSLTATLETFPGVTVVLNVIKHNDRVFAKVQANVSGEANAELQSKVQAYNTMKQGWVYELSPEFYKSISLANADFMKLKD